MTGSRAGAGPCVLMALIDDATNRSYARFYPSETTEAAFVAFGRWVKQHGLPRGLYVDQDSMYRYSTKPELPTESARAMGELGVEFIRAHSPQARGGWSVATRSSRTVWSRRCICGASRASARPTPIWKAGPRRS